MKALELKFDNDQQFMILVELFKDCLAHLRVFVLEDSKRMIYQAWLILEVMDDIYRSKLLSKILSEPEEYKLRLKKSEVIALKLMLEQYDLLTAPSPYTISILTQVQIKINKYLIDNPPKIEQKCVQLLNSATGESSKLIGTSANED